MPKVIANPARSGLPADTTTKWHDFVARAEQLAAGLGTPAEALTQLGDQHWHHSFMLSDGTLVSGGKSLGLLELEFEAILGSVALNGRTLLDVGAWSGAFSFEAKRRGAARVLATDMYAWTHPNIHGLEQFLYVRKDSGLDVEYKMLDIPDIELQAVGKFDIVLFLGVFYHLPEPLSILRRLYEIADPLLILETHLDLEDLPVPAMRYYPGTELGGDGSNWWGPNRQCVEALLRNAGFVEVNYRPHPTNRERGIFIASKVRTGP